MWPDVGDDVAQSQEDRDLYDTHGGVPGALNFFFFRETESGTAYAWVGEGLAMIGEAGPFVYAAGGGGFDGGEDPLLGPVDLLQVVAHELGHALCLQHVCEDDEEAAADTFFQRECEDGDEAYLMYPYWDTSDGMDLMSGEVDIARVGATHVEDGKTSLSHPFDTNRCSAVDMQD
ncbi:MAG: zinc-dependent metalloprotease [Actinomycetota bacterium]|nr:zinc-dependent metalloprotease [Actinomycetota bacterium]